jgi:hypothetical protein
MAVAVHDPVSAERFYALFMSRFERAPTAFESGVRTAPN